MRHTGKKVSAGFAMAALMAGRFIAPAEKKKARPFYQTRADRELHLEMAAAKRARKNAKRVRDGSA